MAARNVRRGGGRVYREALLLQALRNTMRGIFSMHRAREERDQARGVERLARADLARLQHVREAMQSSPGAGPAPGTSYGHGAPGHDPRRGR